MTVIVKMKTEMQFLITFMVRRLQAAAAGHGVSGRLEVAIESLVSNEHIQTKPISVENREADNHFEKESAANRRVWRHINGKCVTGTQESISVFAPDAKNEETEEEHENPLEQHQNELDEEFDEHMATHPKRRAVVRRNDPASPIIANRAGPSGFNATKLSHPNPETSDDEHFQVDVAASLAYRHEKRRLNLQLCIC